MVNEHALKINSEITEHDLNFLIKKANRLGLCNREVSRAYKETDGKETHIYFEAEEWGPHKKRGSL